MNQITDDIVRDTVRDTGRDSGRDTVRDTVHDTVHEPAKAREDRDRAAARKRLEARREFGSHLVAYVVINAALVAVWALTGGYFWPAWVLATWGAGLVLHAYEAFLHRPVTELDIDRELRRRAR